MSDEAKNVEVVAASARVVARVGNAILSVAHGNKADNHVRKLAADLQRIRDGIAAHGNVAATDALNDALNTINKLDEDRWKRHQW